MTDNTTDKKEGNDIPSPAPKKKHWIKTRWLRITLKTLMWILIAILLLPVLVYIPPIQTGLKNMACSIVENSTGMKIGVDKLRIKFPLDVSLKGVTVVEADGDTMVTAREAIADVKILPLLKLDVKINKLQLLDGTFNMMSPDSSMTLRLKAGFLEVDDKSSMDIPKSRILLNKARLRDADIALLMDVWKQKPTPPDTTSTPFFISANDLDIENLRFGMAMLPTIDTLSIATARLALHKGVIDLANNKITISKATLDKGKAVYITPTQEYIASHPVPVDTTAVAKEQKPFTIIGDTLWLKNFSGLYATAGASPLPGFDPSYIEAEDINLCLNGFYNQTSTVRLPFTRIEARERSGLTITSGSGTVGVSELGLTLEDMNVTTLNSTLQADADLPFEAMALQPGADMSVKATGKIGKEDIICFMPDLSRYVSPIPKDIKILLDVDASGSVSDLNISHLNMDIPSIAGLKAKGTVKNPMDIKRLQARMSLDGYVKNPAVADKMAGGLGVELPALTLKGDFFAANQNYGADFSMLSSAGDVIGDGEVNLNAERYSIDASIKGLQIDQFVPDLGIEDVTAEIHAKGRGFNPSGQHTATDTSVKVKSIRYNGIHYKDIDLFAHLDDGEFAIDLNSPNKYLDLTLAGRGTIIDGRYDIDMNADIYHLDLQAMGFSPTPLGGHGGIMVKGWAIPDQWLYDVDMQLEDIDFIMGEGEEVHFPYGASARLVATEEKTDCTISSDRLQLDFESPNGLHALVDRFSSAITLASKQVEEKNLDMKTLQEGLPEFQCRFGAGGEGLLAKFLAPRDIKLDSVAAQFSNTDIIRGNVYLGGIASKGLKVDTLTLGLTQRGSMMDYKAAMANAPGTMDEFANVTANGYLGQNRFSLSLHQKNISGETGYRLGLTGAIQDSALYLHFTPLKATIAYMPWTFNTDNHVDLGPGHQINAMLLAKSKESEIYLETFPDSIEGTRLRAKLDNIKIEDFLKMSALAPPVSGTINSDLNLVYRTKGIGGKGTLNVTNLEYDETRIGNLDLTFRGGTNMADKSGGVVTLNIEGKPALIAKARTTAGQDSLSKDDDGLKMALELTKFPLKLVNAFLPPDMASLEGGLSGHMSLDGSLTKPVLNGQLNCDSVSVFIPMIGSSLRFGDQPLTVDSNLVQFNKLQVMAQNENPLTIDGSVNARKLSSILFDLSLKADNMLVINNTKKANSDIYGKLALNLDASLKGPQQNLHLQADVNVRPNTDVTYSMSMAPSQLTATDASGVVKFVSFNDTTLVERDDSVAPPMLNMRMNASLTISAGTQVAVLLGGDGTVELTPYGTLNLNQNYMGDMRLNGQIYTGNGFFRYAIPVLGDKKFTFEPSSYVAWNGDMMNPQLNLQAHDMLKTTVSQNGSNRLVNFNVGLSVTNNLSAPKVMFDLSTQDDITIQDELSSMSADQRSSTAMNLLITGMYTGTAASAGSINLNNQLYGFLTSKLNNWAANNIKGVDLSFGVDQYDQSSNGRSSTTTSYSYQMSKSLFNNKFKIVVGGNYSTDASADENFSQNLINDIAFEYMLKQTNNMSTYLKLFRHTGFESILEGEITETGVGFVMRRRLSKLKELFRLGRRRKKDTETSPDTLNNASATMPEQSNDSTSNASSHE